MRFDVIFLITNNWDHKITMIETKTKTKTKVETETETKRLLKTDDNKRLQIKRPKHDNINR